MSNNVEEKILHGTTTVAIKAKRWCCSYVLI